MATGYKIDFTDQNDFSSFELREYTTNGPTNPQDNTLDVRATQASTTLLLYGKGSPNYGERIAENMIHMLEHFAGDVEPVYPISGQVWFDKTVSPARLRVFDALRYEVIPDPANPSTAQWVAIQAPSSTEANELLTRYGTPGNKVKVVSATTGEMFGFAVLNAAVLRSGTTIAFSISPTPTASIQVGNWYIGGWEHLIQNNVPLYEDLSAGSHKIVDLADPTATTDAANKGYVDDAINTIANLQDELGELDDVIITTPADNDILVYDSTLFAGAGGWKNDTGAATFLRVTGGNLTGTLDMNGNFIEDVATPTLGGHAANKDYVDAQIGLVGGTVPANLNGLSDVIITGTPGAGSVITFDGSYWVNEEIADFVTNNDLLTRAGGAMTGSLFLSPVIPTSSNEAASKQYVDNQLGSISGDGVVDNALWDSGTKTLTLTRTESLPDINVILSGAGGSSFDITHDITDPNLVVNTGAPGSPLPESPTELAWERAFYESPSYPVVTLEDIAAEINDKLGRLGTVKPRLVFTSNGGDTINLDGPGTITGQCNPNLAEGFVGYSVGSNRLSVYVNGVKQIASEHGYREVETSTPADFGLWHGTETGLDPFTTYNFTVSVNGQAAVTVSVLGSDALRLGNLVDAINAQCDANYFQSGSPNSQWAFGAEIHDSILFFVSALPGTNSSIDLTNGTLFPAMVGSVGGTGSFTIGNVAAGITNPYTPADYGYNEVGRPGTEGFEIEFLDVPASGAVIEVIIEPHIFMEQV